MSVQRVPSVVVAVVAWQRDMIGMRTVTWQRVTIGMRTDVIVLTKLEGAREGTLQLFFRAPKQNAFAVWRTILSHCLLIYMSPPEGKLKKKPNWHSLKPNWQYIQLHC